MWPYDNFQAAQPPYMNVQNFMPQFPQRQMQNYSPMQAMPWLVNPSSFQPQQQNQSGGMNPMDLMKFLMMLKGQQNPQSGGNWWSTPYFPSPGQMSNFPTQGFDASSLFGDGGGLLGSGFFGF